ncbi:DUF1775 domain-containing protein [Streptomyces spongiicola]|uniref:DUF1775 domain-containing protein n=1 Tax=Streptomyces spongiicola TaxID=1690221 RepID=A0A388SVL9_9ACTN|nr:DUF1775 domain-containing protein [Streptomyces spongiicola]GBP99044.1 DUF1775 domain-containing protein [Streptomyces spongiicola]
MPRSTPARTPRRIGVLTTAAFAAVVAGAGPATAHTEVEAPGARALDQNVALTFTAASESDTAGISRLEVILPEGMAPRDITYREGPEGWKFATTSRGYTVSGPKLPVGEDAEYVVTARQLPDVPALHFKTLQTYDDGQVDRWIELEEEKSGEAHGHSHPAPRLALEPAAPGAKPVGSAPEQTPEAAPSTTGPSPAEAAGGPQPEATAAAEAAAGDGGGIPVAATAGIAAAVLALGGGAWWFRNRRGGTA